MYCATVIQQSTVLMCSLEAPGLLHTRSTMANKPYNTTSFHGNIHVYNNWILASLNLCSSLVHTLGTVPFHGDIVMGWIQDFCKGRGGGGVKNNIQTGGLWRWALEYLIVSWCFKLNDQEEELSSCLHSWELWVEGNHDSWCAFLLLTPPSTSAVGLCGFLCLMRMTRSFSRLTSDKVTITSPPSLLEQMEGR